MTGAATAIRPPRPPRRETYAAPRWTSARAGLGRTEIATTAVAAAVCAGCWAAFRDPYLARGAVGAALGFLALTVPLVRSGRRARHEALVCLVAIGMVSALRWRWPLALPSSVWWTVLATDLAAYLALRRGLLARDPLR